MANLTDVARAARVSIATVSRVVNQPGTVKAETRRRVAQAMERLGYRPNRVARRLRQRSGRRQLLGIIIPEIDNFHFAEIVRGVEEAAYERQFALILCNSEGDAAKQRFYLEVLRAESVDGIIAPPLRERDPLLLAAAADGLPIVTIDRRLASRGVDSVVVDNGRGAELAVDRLIGRGCRAIGHIAGPLEVTTARERWEGWRRTLIARGISPRADFVYWGDNRHESGAAGARALLALAEAPQALFVGNNLMTAGALEAIHQLGLKVPEDVAILGFDDPPWAAALRPALTTIRQPTRKIGRLAVELLLRRLAEPDSPRTRLVLPPELLVRESA